MSSSSDPEPSPNLGAAAPRILVADDNDATRDALEAGLELFGHRVLTRVHGGDALADAVKFGAALVILAGTPLQPPEVLCAKLKKNATTRSLPVLVIVGSPHEQLRIRAFEAGADDVVVRPFGLRELSLRVRVLLERRRPRREARFRSGLLSVDFGAHRAFVASTEVVLTRRELEVLARLCAECDHPVSRDVLFDGIWGPNCDLDVRTVDAHVSRLKLKLGAAGCYIRSVRSFGYVLDSCRRRGK